MVFMSDYMNSSARKSPSYFFFYVASPYPPPHTPDCACALKYLIDFLKTKSTITPGMSLFHEVQDISREHLISINRANQFYIADMQIMKVENRGKPQDRSYKHRIFTNPVKILRFLNRTVWCDCYFSIRTTLFNNFPTEVSDTYDPSIPEIPF